MKKGSFDLLLMGGSAIVGKDNIHYSGYDIPPLTPPDPSQSQPLPFVPPPPVDVRSNINIVEGEFSCSYKIDGSSSYFSVNLWGGNDNLLIGINDAPHFCTIKKYQNGTFSLVNFTGASGSMVYGKDASFKIKINSAYVSILINNIIILSHSFVNNGVSIGLNIYGSSAVEINNIEVYDKKPKVFVVMQFDSKFNDLYTEVIKPVCNEYGLDVTRADESTNNGSIIRDILAELVESTLIIADITPDNANVYYEVGYAHAIKKDTILLCDEQRVRLPFDLADFRTIFYKDSIAGHSQIKERLRKHLDNILNKNLSGTF
ncbi:hypothetical protein L8P34_01755 [Enterobacter kobei]|uniref:hypothetical protein n=1 Tax=Enterobacter kobei TaxID=208224 RepID=UPI00200529EB|nr:hypothetical protein [Enterobacter kobei]MCK7110283.1 hypothetical protein [Enterobacter kobei]